MKEKFQQIIVLNLTNIMHSVSICKYGLANYSSTVLQIQFAELFLEQASKCLAYDLDNSAAGKSTKR